MQVKMIPDTTTPHIPKDTKTTTPTPTFNTLSVMLVLDNGTVLRLEEVDSGILEVLKIKGETSMDTYLLIHPKDQFSIELE